MDFRYEAREAIKRARKELDSEDEQRLKYAALELRNAMEALTYDRARLYKEELPASEYETWQPRKLLQTLLEIDAHADQDSTLSFGLEDQPGEPAKTMELLGNEKVLNLSAIKKHYDALGSYLHMPTLKQLQQSGGADLKKLRKRCEDLATQLELVLQSAVWNINFANFASMDCQRCGKIIRKRFPSNVSEVEAKCIECGAEYRVSDEGPNKVLWQAQQQDVACPMPSCTGKVVLWRDDFKPGVAWKCPACETPLFIAMIVKKDDNPPPPGQT